MGKQGRRGLAFWVVSLLAILLLVTTNSHGQANAYTAALSGSVRDLTGAVVPAAKVTLTSVNQGFSRVFSTLRNGRYTFPLLPPGTYTIRVEKTGFRPYAQAGIILNLAQTATVDVTLQLGSVSQTITVTAGASMLNTVNSNIGPTITTHQLLELPLDFRNVYSLTTLNSSVNNSGQMQVLNPPGTNSNYDDQDIGFLNPGGGRFGTTAYLLDGHWNVAGDWGGIIYAPNVDGVAEMKIQTNSFSAQYGLSMGQVINVITKSGTNSFHGDVYEFDRNAAFDANNFFNNRAGLPRPGFTQNQFGFTMGGPLYIPKLYEQRNKTFIFGYYNGYRISPPVTLVTTLPTAAMRNGDFSALLGAQVGTDALGRPAYSGQIYDPFSTRSITAGQVDPVTGLVASETGTIRDPFAGNKIPASFLNPVSQKLIPYWPLPNTPGLVNNFTATGAAPATEDDYSVRVDHTISDKSRMFVRWSQKRQFLTLAAPFFGSNNPAGPENGVPDPRWDAAFDYNHIFNPTFLMDVDFGWNREDERRAPQGGGFKPSSVGLPPFLDTYAANFPSISPQSIYGLGAASNGGGSIQSFPRNDRTYSLDFSKIAGGHTMNFGLTVVTFQQNDISGSQAGFSFPLSMTSGPNPISPTSATGYGFASFFLGTGTGGGVTLNADDAEEKNYYAGYFQDDWRITPKLTLNLGIRYDYQGAITERFNRLSYFDFTSPNPVSTAVGVTVPGQLVFTNPAQRGVYSPQKNNFAPRVGLAYRISNKLVLRSGFGIFYIPTLQLSAPLNGFSQTTPYVGTVNGITPVNLLSNPFPTGLIFPQGRALGGMTDVGLSVGANESYLPTPYVNQWMFGFQYEPSPNNSLEVDYVGNHGVKLPFNSIYKNQLPDQYLSLGSSLLDSVPNPFYGYIPSSACGLNDPTVIRGQLLLPYPEFCGVSDNQPPAGVSNYNALQVTFTHRFSHGLQALVSYTASKYLDNTTGPDGWADPGGQPIRDNYNLANEYSLDANDIPNSLVVSYIYQLPLGKGERFGRDWSRPVDAVLGGWQVTGITTLKNGFPLSFTNADNTSGSFGGGQTPNLVGNPHLTNPTINEWFNTSAFAQPSPFTFGDVPRTMPNLRAPGYKDWDIGIMKWWRQTERLRLQFRAEMFNAFNEPQFYAPGETFGSPNFGQVSGAFPGRDVQFALKAYW